MIEQDAVGTLNVIGFAVVQREIETRHFTDAVGASGMKRCSLALRCVVHLTKHLARPGKIELALRLQLPDSLQDVVSPVDIGAHGGEAVGEALRYKPLSGQVIAFIELLLGENVKYAGVAVQAGGMDVDAVQASFQAAQTLLGLLKRDAPDHSMNLVA